MFAVGAMYSAPTFLDNSFAGTTDALFTNLADVLIARLVSLIIFFVICLYRYIT